MKKLYVERLKRLYQVIGGIPSKRISMGSWRKQPEIHRSSLARFQVDNEALMHNCGTVACALGWATAHPDFIEQGLVASNVGAWTAPTFGGEIEYEAGAKFFGLTADQSYGLFYPAYGLDAVDQKGTFLRRLRDLMVKQRIITRARSGELAAEEANEAWAVAA